MIYSKIACAVSFSLLGGFCLSSTALAQGSKKPTKEPQAFTTNCKACHLLDEEQVGPSLIEIAKLYPRKRKKEFIKWCVDPGKKRPEMPQMPSMAHIPEEQLEEIHAYIQEITKGKNKRVRTKADEYKNSPTAVARPRVTRTFLPKTGPASMVLALPTSEKHNVIWDTDQCRVRYISYGEIDNFPYLRSNGNSLAKEGAICYTEEALFTAGDKLQYRGYQLNKKGYATLYYTLGDVKITEAISVDGKTIIRSITADPKLPAFTQPKSSEKLDTKVEVSGNTLKIIHTPR